MKQIYILVIIIAGFLFSPMAWGQDDNYQQKKDSLSRIIPKQTGEEKLSSYWDLTHYHFLTLEDDESLEKLFQLLDEYQAEAKKQNHLGALGSIIVTKTDAFYNLSKRDEMIQYVYENVEFLRKNELLQKTTFQTPETDAADELCPESRKDKFCLKLRDLLLKEKIYRDDKLSRDSLTERLAINRYDLEDAFKFCFGMSYSECINELRLNDAVAKTPCRGCC
ncbi:hypothetical protein AGMMS50239_25800 [Bacteroidia bacterium]|nr:hypothetical protein AGMMS50239_25800 [Bacteroidia bacterium]